jgi:SagB-type dehydrogenase family enzyme
MAPRSKEPDVARLFHVHSSNTKERVIEMRVDEDRRPARFRTYPGARRFPLGGRDFAIDLSLGAALAQRRSLREFALGALALETVGRLLHASFGVRGQRQVEGEWTLERPSPSAGGLYPLELYVAAQCVEGLADGVYHYDPRAHELELRRTGAVHDDLAELTIGQDMIRQANLVVVLAGIPARTMWKYGQRGYRYMWLDAGHVGQNVYLVATALGLGPVAIGGFYDQEVGALFGLPPGEEEAIYLLCVGLPRP